MCAETHQSCGSGDFVTIGELARMIGMDKSHALRFTKKLRTPRVRIRTAKSGNQATVAFTQADAEAVCRARELSGYSLRNGDSSFAPDPNSGFFYVIQLIPEFSKNRIKLGFTNDLSARLAEHRTTCPTAVYAITFPCRREWEATIMQFIAAGAGLTWIGGEVFEGDIWSLEKYVENLRQVIPEKSYRMTRFEQVG